jgi:type VI protein secretion system component VasK
MKFNRYSTNRKRRCTASGSAVLVVVILLGIMTTLVVANSRTLYYLHRDLKVTEQKQQRRLEKTLPAKLPATASATNQVEQVK